MDPVEFSITIEAVSLFVHEDSEVFVHSCKSMQIFLLLHFNRVLFDCLIE